MFRGLANGLCGCNIVLPPPLLQRSSKGEAGLRPDSALRQFFHMLNAGQQSATRKDHGPCRAERLKGRDSVPQAIEFKVFTKEGRPQEA
jgi:hypothetical protein